MNISKQRINSVRAILAVLLGVLPIGCGSGGSGGSAAGGGATGTMAVSLTDDPACGFNAVYVTPSQIRVHQSAAASDTDHGWTEITLNPPQKINLLDLNNGTLLSLGQAPLTAGHYQQLRLVLVPNSNNPQQPLANSVILTNSTTEIPLATPSAIHSGIKLIHHFDVAAGQHVDVVLDFNACHSIVARNNGTYALKPVVQVMTDVLKNGIGGVVAMSLLASNVVVTAQQNGTVVRTTVPNTQTGEFFLGLLPTDPTHCPSFPCHFDVVITADGSAAAVIASVPLASHTSRTHISTSASPLTLPASNSQSISGTVTLSNPATDEGMVLVGAKQTVNTGPTVTIKSQVATALLTTGTTGDYAYTLTLPVDAPVLYLYSTPLPLIPSSANQSAVAGVYTVVGAAQVLQADGSTTTYATQNPAPHAVTLTATTGVTGNDFTVSP